MLNCDYLFLSKDYLFTLIKMSRYFILSYYHHICLPKFIWNSPTHHKHAPGKRGIICAQAEPNWVVVRLVSTPLLRIFGPSTVGGSPTWFNQKRPITRRSKNQQIPPLEYTLFKVHLTKWLKHSTCLIMQNKRKKEKVVAIKNCDFSSLYFHKSKMF